MRMVEFCQESTSFLTDAVSCLLLASCSFRVSNSCRLVASCFFRILNSCWLTHCHDACGEIWHIISEPDWGYLCSSPFCAVAATRDDVSTAARIISSCILLCFKLISCLLQFYHKNRLQTSSSSFAHFQYQKNCLDTKICVEVCARLFYWYEIWWESFFNMYVMMTKHCWSAKALLYFEQIIMLTA